MPSRTFTVDELEEWCVDDENEYRESVDSGRWSEYFSVVFRAEDDGKLYHVMTQEGLTEYQDYSGSDCYPVCTRVNDEWVVECPEVELYQKQVLVTKWRKVA